MAKTRKALEQLRQDIAACEQWLADNPERQKVADPVLPVLPAAPEPPDTSDLEAKISQGEANRVLFVAYQERLEKAAKKTTEEELLKSLETRQRELRSAKIARLKGIDTLGVTTLSFDENGDFTYENTGAGMLSTSQIMRLSSQLSSLYPSGFGLELIDRAESLGKSIFSFIERAQREQKKILATIVGEKPAQVPEHVGVFVVEEGMVK
ncbi:MAG: hypothetical protein ACP5SH_25355 [Syntrophobacteraceae bacterium]